MNDLLRQHHAEECVGCGRCTYACVAAQRHETFSPRRVVEDALAGKETAGAGGLWACTACGGCTMVCNAGVEFPSLVRDLRKRSRIASVPTAAHHGILNRAARLTASGLRPRSAGWVTPDLEIDPRSDVLLFVGCTPYIDATLRYIRDDLLEIPRSAVRLLNAMGIRPRVLTSERCCGHDAYWAGDDELFEKLARANLEEMKAMGIRRIVAFCPECLSAWRYLYPRALGETGIEARSVIELVAEAVRNGEIRLRPGGEVLTYQDPCRMSKGAGLVEEPREIIRAVGGLVDMPRSGAMSACCGTAGWLNCDHTAKRVQVERLEEAGSTGADMLLTACPKCLVHLSCADRHHGAELPRRVRIEDLHVRAANALVR
ncbi:MAG: (Fe-S)-binding protein [Methanomassiliicoccus sp.]|nr:(Fe-S)-binding protein [Methanomassiliicoccus sp.]